MENREYARIIQTLEHNGYKVRFFETAEEAANYLTVEIQNMQSETPDQKLTVGFGDSQTLAALKLDERLGFDKVLKQSTGNCEIINPGRTKSLPEFLETARKTLTTDVFLTSVNAVAETGEMVNIDGTGNRVAGSLFGHRKVFFVFGTNKITRTLDEAIYRARNIAAPQNAKRHKYQTPCALNADKGYRCYDCSSPERICNCLVIYMRAERFTESEVVIINESLGL